MKNYGRLMDVIDRAYAGPPCAEDEFDMKFVAEGVAKVVKKYGIEFDKSRIVQCDDDLSDRLWEAALDFVTYAGFYNTSTGRRMSFSRREIEEAIKWAPSEATIGDKSDKRLEVHRDVEDRRPPLVVGGPIGTPLSEELYVPIMQSYIQEPIVDAVCPGTLKTTFGREPRSKSPLEVVAAWEEVELMFAAARRAGRPGISINAVEMATSDVGHLSAISRGGYRPTDWQMTCMFSELKTSSELLIKGAHSVCTDGNIHAFHHPILGGLGRGEEGVAVLIVAGLLGCELLYMATTLSTAPVAVHKSIDTLPPILRALSVAFTALSRHTPLMFDAVTSPLAGPCTSTLLYECVAIAAMGTVCGAARLFGVRSAAGVVPDHCTGLELRFNGEVGHGVVGMTREEVDEIVRKAVARYEPDLAGNPIGKPFQEAYDLMTLHPKPEWQAIYDQVKESVANWGVRFS